MESWTSVLARGFALWREAAPTLFAVALVAAFVGAVWPNPSSDQMFGSDKILHIVAFAVLSFVGFFAVPRDRVLRLGIGLSIYGALIEIVQGMPFVGRDADPLDWVADTLSVAVVLCVMAVARKFLAPHWQ